MLVCCLHSAMLMAESRYQGEKRALCLLLSFSDANIRATNANNWEKQLNAKDYVPNKGVGSVRDYFHDMSYGTFDLQFDCLRYRASGTRVSYASSHVNSLTAAFAPALTEALQALYADGALTDEMLARYDWDGDGEVEQVVVICAGPAGQNMPSPIYIRSHEGTLSSSNASFKLGLQRINTYAACAELRSDNRTLDGIGGVVHEMMHCFGLPDFYSKYSSVQSQCYTGMDGFWDVMDIGTYNGDNYNGTIPPQMTSFERWKAGWLTPVVLDAQDLHVEAMQPLMEAPVAYLIYNTQSARAQDHMFRIPEGVQHKEFYLVENRASSASFARNGRCWDSPIGTFSGLLIVHVDYDENNWNSTAPNSRVEHQRMTILPADGNLLGPWHNYLDASVAADVWSSGDVSPLTVYHGTSPLPSTLTRISVDAQGCASFDYHHGLTDGLASPAMSAGNRHPVYDPTGRSVAAPRHGLYIVAGRKQFFR